MRTTTIRVPAKINLSLDVVGQRPDGYHLLSSIMQAVDLLDEVRLETTTAEAGIQLSSDLSDWKLDDDNTVCRAARSFLRQAGIDAGLRIHLTKRIPLSAGLGGGSADAAAVLTGLSHLFPGRVTTETLSTLAVAVGADVPYCLVGGTALCEGIGEYVTPLPPFTGHPVLLVKPDFGVATAWVFAHLDRDQLGVRPDNARMIPALAAGDWRQMARTGGNVLESVTVSAYPFLQEIKRQLQQAGAAYAAMSGSGPTMFGLFAGAQTRDDAAERLAATWEDAVRLWPVDTVGYGPLPAAD